jgi:tetratricopeptide (TPR) repeat protein
MIELLLAADRLLAAGDLDHAERIYRQVIEADPRNAIAEVGLAQVAEARGAHAEAVALARRALDIDPEDQVARRIVGSGAAPEAPAGAHPDLVDEGVSPGVTGTGPSVGADVPVAGGAPGAGKPSLLARLKAFLGLGR